MKNKAAVSKSLLCKCIKGDQDSQKILFHALGPSIKFTAHRYARNSADAQDIFQEAFVAIFTNLSKLRKPEKILGWAKQITVRSAIHYYRQHQPLKLVEPIESPTIEREDLVPDSARQAKELMQFIQDLPDGYRMVFNMYQLEGLSHQEIAEILNISPSTSRSQLAKAKRFLRKKMELHHLKKTAMRHE